MKLPKLQIELQEIVDKAMKQVLDETTIEGVTIREWIDNIVTGKYKKVEFSQWDETKVAFMKQCTQCGCTVDQSQNYDYCPKCGRIITGVIKLCL